MNLSFIKKVTPFLGAVIGTAVPAAAPFIAIASKLLSTGLGKDVKPQSDAILQTITEAMGTPADVAKLKEIDHQYELQLAQMGINSAEEFEQIASADRADARSMQVQTKSKIPGALAIGVTLGFFGLLWVSAFHAAPTQSEKILDVMLGSLGMAWLSIVNYYFGSSAGSAEKTRLLALAPAVDNK